MSHALDLGPLPFVLLLVLFVLTGGCRDRSGEPAYEESSDSVTVVFSRAEAPAPVRRPIEQETSALEAALTWLVRGPTPEEEASGIGSWFSDDTAASLRSVTLFPSGHAVVDFHDLRPVIPGASSSTGSTLLLQELNGTLFLLPEVRAVEYRMEGSCDLFWEWLQYGCQTVER